MKIPSGEPGVSSAARAVDLDSRIIPSRTYRWGWVATTPGGELLPGRALWFKTQRASRSWARQHIGACVLMEYYSG